MGKKSKKAIYAEYICFRVLLFIFRLIPIDTALMLARLMGRIVFIIDRRHRAITLDNLRMAFGGEKSDKEIKRIARKVYENIVMTGVEALKLDRILNRDNWRRYVSVEGYDRAERIFRDGRGAIFITGHIGNWELNAYMMRLVGYPLHSIAREFDNPLIEKYVSSHRRQLGADIVGKHGALKKLVRYLRDGEYIGMVVDQDGGKNGVFVEFFGRKASWVPSAAALALKMKVPVVPVYSRRVGNRFRHTIYVDEIIEPLDTGNRDEDIKRIIEKYSKGMERFIRSCPEQWMWNHRRWRTRPPEEMRKGNQNAEKRLNDSLMQAPDAAIAAHEDSRGGNLAR